MKYDLYRVASIIGGPGFRDDLNRLDSGKRLLEMANTYPDDCRIHDDCLIMRYFPYDVYGNLLSSQPEAFLDNQVQLVSLEMEQNLGVDRIIGLTDLVHVYDVPIFAQLGFVQFNKHAEHNMRVEDVSIEDIRKIQTDFIKVCQKIDYAGFDGVQIALGNYYFLTRFISPSFNKRTDKYGGNTLNRLRIVLEMIKVIKQTTNLHINCRLNAFDIQAGGATIEDTIEIAKLLEKFGVDSLQITRPRSPQYFSKENIDRTSPEIHDMKVEKINLLTEECERIIDSVNIPVIMGGGVNSKSQINKILNETNIDFISMQRPFVYDPSFLIDWQMDDEAESKCKLCNNCYWKKTSTCFINRPATWDVER